ncbi:integrin beta 3 [Sphingomonas gellani]|uniref:Integrin beta 3 n=1 Tax=Sphingomonas gellani TaxID=1166340 RepID=A0A1H7Z5U2_9SPHN|nr:collagen-like protein [Sphingomonas gellani]SEM53810.1 integrin beta 3 [Sphingomonas gellani]
MLDTRALAAVTAEIVREHLDSALAPLRAENVALLARIEALEGRQPERGEAGSQGERGLPGADGRDGVGMAGALIDRAGNLVLTLTDGTVRELGVVVGRDGVDGAPGEPGARGAPGSAGSDGRDGRDGTDGKDGANGEPGRDGSNGVDGKDGAPGRDGADGADGAAGHDGGDGKDGRDGIDGAAGRDGVHGENGRDGADGRDAYAGEARGLFDPEASYRAMDVVASNGCEWRAKRDVSGEVPGASDAWMLSASRGKRGAPGEQGKPGRDGADGKPGASPIAAKMDHQTMILSIARDDGEVFSVDFGEAAEAIRSA